MSIQGKNILFIINGLRYGGMERQLIELIKTLKNSDYNLSLAVLNKQGPFSSIVQPFLDKPIQYFDRRKTQIFKTIINLYRFVKNNKIQIIYVQDNFSAFYALPVSKLLKIPFINGSIRHAGVSQGLDYYYEKIMLKSSSIIVSNSKAGLRFFQINNGFVIPNFIDLTRFKKSNRNLNNIIMNANFHDYKDHATFFKAMHLLYEQKRINKIGLIGDGPRKNTYEELVKKLGMSDLVTFYGHVNNIEEILPQYGIGVLCSTKKYKEGISNSLLEYMGSGLVAVGTNIGGTPEIIEDEITGFLFEPENEKSLYHKILFIQNNEEKMDHVIQAAYKNLEQNHSPAKNIQKYIAILERV